ncbi:hypothetical protein AB0L50_20610 [Streptomyces flaveolus]|uniref:hypothetical protein n=1 Tax=Streptomyces flaveolus TaxID=67297 RepID=UPI0034496914
MGHFALHVKYTGDTPPGPPPEGSFQFLATGWTGLLGSSFTRNLDAACLAPGSATDVYLFQGDQYVRYDCRSEDMGYGTKKLSDGWPGLRGTNFTSNLDAACSVPGRAVLIIRNIGTATTSLTSSEPTMHRVSPTRSEIRAA